MKSPALSQKGISEIVTIVEISILLVGILVTARLVITPKQIKKEEAAATTNLLIKTNKSYVGAGDNY